MPAEFVLLVRSCPGKSRRTTVAPGIIAPDTSVTVPRTLPVVTAFCASSAANVKIKKKQSRFIGILVPAPDSWAMCAGQCQDLGKACDPQHRVIRGGVRDVCR